MRSILSVISSIGLLFLTCCSKELNYEVLADKITAETAQKLKKEKELYPIGTGGQMMFDIQVMSLSFQFFHTVTLQEARELLITAIQEYLIAINNNKKLRPYLHNYPFTAKNVEIMIWIHTSDRSELPLGSIKYLSAIDGILKYALVQPNPSAERILVCKETYEEALKKLQEDQLKSTLRQSNL